MTSHTHFSLPHTSNPLDELEIFFSKNSWDYSRDNNLSLSFAVREGWCTYHFQISWKDDVHALYFVCSLPLTFPQAQRYDIHCITSMINRSLGMGHFEVEEQASCVAYRHTLPLRGLKSLPVSIIHDVISVALAECERFFPAFNLLISQNYPIEQALDASLTTSCGHA